MESIERDGKVWVSVHDCFMRVAQEEQRWMKAEATIAAQAATIERFREWYRAETDCRNSGDIIVNFWDAPTTKRLDRRREAYEAITKADMGEAE